jgi:hypothetical protein
LLISNHRPLSLDLSRCSFFIIPFGRNTFLEAPAAGTRRSHGPYHGRLLVMNRGSEVMHISWRSGNNTGNSSMAVDRCVGRLSDEPSVEFCVDTDGSTSSSRPLFSRALNSMRKLGRGGRPSAPPPPSSSSTPSASGMSRE